MITCIRAGRMIDGTGAPPVDQATIVIEDGRIKEVATEGRTVSTGTADVETIDCHDQTVLPGLIDCHVHLVFSADSSALNDILTEDDGRLLLRAVHNSQVALRAGVTTVRDCGGKYPVVFALRDSIERGILPGPRIFAAGPAITTTGGHCYFLDGEADSADDLRKLARHLAKHGADFFKVMATGGRMTPGSNVCAPQFSLDELLALMSEARRLHRTVAAHCHGVAGIRNAVAAGVTTIEHCTWISEEDSSAVAFDRGVAREMANRGVYLDATLSPSIAAARIPESEMTPTRIETRRLRPIIEEAHRAMLAEGVELVAGTDAGVSNVPLDSMPQELEGLVERLGVTPLDAIKAATHTASRACGREEEFGSIQVGRVADLLVVSGDPSRDISDTRRVRLVLRNGIVEVEDGRLVRS